MRRVPSWGMDRINGSKRSRALMRAPLIVTALALVLATLAACAPGAVQDEPAFSVAVINAPQDAQVIGTASAFVEGMRGRGASGFDLLDSVGLRGLERRRDLSGSRAIPNAARIARSVGAEYALMVGAVDVEREVESMPGNEARIVVELAVEGVLVDAGTERVVARVSSRPFTGERVVEADEARALPELLRDPTVVAVAEEAARSLARTYREVLQSLVNESSSG